MNRLIGSPRFFACLLILLCRTLPALAVGDAAATTSTRGQADGALHHLFQHFESIASPGPLSQDHARLDQPDGCGHCHQGTRGLSNEFCLACHGNVGERIKKKIGLHGAYAGDCFTCHQEHQGRGHSLIELDKKKFDHGKTRYPLQGAHRTLACTACHRSRKDNRQHYLIGLPEGCTSCHVAPHSSNISRDCTACHTQDGWRPAAPLKFNHQTQTRFPLRDRHLKIACEQCHKDPKTFNISTQCAACHADPHAGQFKGQSCAACHSEAGFKRPNLKFNHTTMTSFTLVGRHSAVTCERCHAGMKDFRISTACASCHADPHKAQFGAPAACQTCHQPAGWTGKALRFKHDTMTRFPLTGHHRALSCNDCHLNGKFRGTPMNCDGCHENPHQGRYARSCEKCHATAGFSGEALKFDHNRQTPFPLTGLHATRDCAQCHADLSFRVLGVTCTTCHADVERFYAGTLLSKIVPGKPDPMHGSVKCSDCHKPTDPKADPGLIRPRCIACHNPHYGIYLDESRQVIAERLNRLPTAVGKKPENRNAAEAIRRLGAHNVIYAGKLLDALGAGAPAEAK